MLSLTDSLIKWHNLTRSTNLIFFFYNFLLPESSYLFGFSSSEMLQYFCNFIWFSDRFNFFAILIESISTKLGTRERSWKYFKNYSVTVCDILRKIYIHIWCRFKIVHISDQLRPKVGPKEERKVEHRHIHV